MGCTPPCGPVFLPHQPPLPCRHQTFLQLLHTLQGQLPCPEAETEPPRKLDPAEDEPQQRNAGDAVGRDGAGPSEVSERWAGGREVDRGAGSQA